MLEAERIAHKLKYSELLIATFCQETDGDVIASLILGNSEPGLVQGIFIIREL